ARWQWLSVAACLTATLTKEVAVTAPVLVLLYDRVFCSPSFKTALAKRRGYYAALVLACAPMIVLMFTTHLGERSVATRAGADWFYYALTESKVLALYIRLALWPYPLVFDYGQEILVREVAPVAGYLALTTAALAGTVFLFV